MKKPKILLAASILCSLSMCKYKEYTALRYSLETLHELESQNDKMREQITQIEADIEAFKNNKLFQEKVIRDELGWVRKGDLIINFDCIEEPKVLDNS